MYARRMPVLYLLAAFALAACSDGGTSYQPCTTDDDCESGFVCESGECREAPGCTGDEDCKGDRACIDGICQEPEDACTVDTDCPDKHKCEDGQCLEVECRVDEDCPDNHHCEAYQCTADECITDADCGADEECVDGSCQPREVQSCTDDEDCRPDELCLDDECQQPPECEADADCPDGTVCEHGRCARPCTSDEECGQFHVCRNGHCLQQCVNDATCQEPGTICEDNVCVPAECLTDADCTEELTRCVSGRCESYTPCETDEDCGDPNWVCIEQICEELPTCAIDQDCTGSKCAEPPCVCKDGHCHPATTCTAEEDCLPEEDCVGGWCVPHVCRGPEDCEGDQVCVGGECVDPGDPGSVTEIVILTPGGPIYQGQQVQLQAVALTANGQEVPGVIFNWESSEPDRASIDAAGVLTGGDQAGDTLVTASAEGSVATSDPVIFTNILELPADTLRVTVVSGADRGPVESATVMLVTSAGEESAQTGTDGTVSFTDPQEAVDVHVFSDGYDFVSVVGTSSVDLMIPVPPRSDPGRQGGFTGQMTFPGTEAVELGLAGSSIGGNLVDLNFGRLLGEIFTVTVTTPMGSFDLSLPAQMVMGANYQGMPFEIKNTYYVVGRSGLRTAWGLGGNLDMSVLYEIAGGGGSAGEILIGLLPYFAVFDHGLRPTVELFPMAKVEDTDDIDGDADTAEMRPDWANFADVDLTPDQPQSMAVQLTAPELPTHGGGPITIAVFIAGAYTELGLTPLGLTAAEDSGGVIEPLRMKMAPVYGGLQTGHYAVAVLGIPSAGGAEIPTDVAMVLHMSTTLPTDLEFASGFLAFPEDADWNMEERTMVAGGVTGATLFRSTILGEQGKWEVYLANREDTVSFTLPAPPAGMDDLAAGSTVTLDPIALGEGTGFDELITANGDDLDRLNLLMTACSRFELK